MEYEGRLIAKAGDIWEQDGQTVEWQKDMYATSVLTVSCMKINGAYQKVGDIIPGWIMERGRRINASDV